jgi:hypothetical protein
VRALSPRRGGLGKEKLAAAAQTRLLYRASSAQLDFTRRQNLPADTQFGRKMGVNSTEVRIAQMFQLPMHQTDKGEVAKKFQDHDMGG